MPGVEYSEYDGEGVMSNTVYPKGQSALTPEDKLRLDSLTGQHDDSRAPVDPTHWYGNMGPVDKEAYQREARREIERERRLRRDQQQRYRESR